MKEDLMLLKRMPWKHRVIMVCLSVMSIILCLFAFDSPILVVKGFLFSIILLVASYFDIRTRIIPDWIHVLFLLIGLLDFEAISSICGLLLLPLPFLIMALVQEGSIGGGDIKLVSAIGFTYKGVAIYGSLIGMVILVLKYIVVNRKGNIAEPLIPYLAIGNFIFLIVC